MANININLTTSEVVNTSGNGIGAQSGSDYLVNDSTITNSDASYNNVVVAEGNLVLPDVTNTDSDGSPVITPAQTPFVCTPAVAPLNTANLFKTGIDVSARTGDDGDLQNGRGADWFTLGYINPWGHGFRFCGNTGGYTDGTNYFDVNGIATTYALAFPNDELCDWAYYDQINLTVPMWYLVSQGTLTPSPALNRGGKVGGKSANTAIDECNVSTQNGYNDWYLPNIMELTSLVYWANAVSNGGLNYMPFDFDPTGRTPSISNWRLLSSSLKGGSGAYYVTDYTGIANVSVTSTTKGYFMKRTALLTDLGL